jgi:hypothetical protein
MTVGKSIVICDYETVQVQLRGAINDLQAMVRGMKVKSCIAHYVYLTRPILI